MNPKLIKFLRGKASNRDKCLSILALANDPILTSEVKKILVSLGVRSAKSWNISAALGARPDLAVQIDQKWHLQPEGQKYLQSLGITKKSDGIVRVALDLRSIFEGLAEGSTKNYVREAIKCYEYGLHRAAVILSWMATIHVLKSRIVENRLSDFNIEAKRVFGTKWKVAINEDDIGKMKERDILDRMEAISMIGKNTKIALIACLDLRNSCGHPNSLVVGENATAAHIETLLNNVFLSN